jgi:methyl-accepting chemotaxis protein
MTMSLDSVEIDLGEAMRRHSEWKMKLRGAIARKEQLDVAVISRDDCCPLGRWLHGGAAGTDAPRHKNPQYKGALRDVIAKHKVFHVEAGKVAQMINAAKFTEAEAALGGGAAYTNASVAVVGALHELKKVASL